MNVDTSKPLAVAKVHAEEQYPLESCGYYRRSDDTISYVPCRNAHDEPEEAYEIDDADFARDFAAGRVAAVIHSHPEGPEYPTSDDMASCEELDVPYVIIPVFQKTSSDGDVIAADRSFTLGDPDVPELIGRPFRHGVTDCYSLIKDWYLLERNVRLPEYPRDWAWWDGDEDLYTMFFAEAGFRPLRSGEIPREGDVFLACVRSKRINHGGIYLGNDLILHHTTGSGIPYDPNSLSVRDSATRWQNSNFFRMWIRYDPEGSR